MSMKAVLNGLPRPPLHPNDLAWPPMPVDTNPVPISSNQKRFHDAEALAAFGENWVNHCLDSQSTFTGDTWALCLLLHCLGFDHADGDKELARLGLEAWSKLGRLWRNNRQHSCNLSGYAFMSSLSLAGADLSYILLRGCHFIECDISNTRFSHSTLTGAMFTECQGQGTRLDRSILAKSNFDYCTFEHAAFGRAKLERSSLSECVFRKCDFSLSNISGMSIRNTRFLATTGLFGKLRATTPDAPIQDYDAISAVFSSRLFASADAEWKKKFSALCSDRITWEMLRVIGAFRLFGVSYIGIAAIIAYTTVAQSFNRAMLHASESAAAHVETGILSPASQLWARVLGEMPDLPVPVHFGTQMIATALVALAATIYALCCPAEIKEATEVRWTRAMNQPLWEYRAANWSRMPLRYVCAVCFAIGGLYSLCYLLWQGAKVARYLLLR